MAERIDMVATIRQADIDGALFADGATVTVAVSGGADSVALVHALQGYAPERGLSLHVAHLDHGLRPGSADEAMLVDGLARSLGLPATLGSRDVRSIARRQRRGLEHAARSARYAFLALVAAETGSSMVAVGHTADDQAETLLLRIARGTGLEGLRGMAWRGPYPLPVGDIVALEPAWPAGAEAPALVRPLLGAWRDETGAYAAGAGLAVTRDPSNLDTEIARNRVRHEVLPLLAQLNPGVRSALVRLALSARDDEALLSTAIDAAWDRVGLEVSPGRAILDRAALVALSEAMQRRLLRRAIAIVGGGAPDVGWAHVEAARAAAAGAGSRGAADLPGLLRVERDADWVLVGRRGAIATGAGGDWSVPLAAPGRTELPGGWALETGMSDAAIGSTGCREGAWAARLDADLPVGALVARSRRPGDRMAPAGLGGRHRTLQDIFVDLRVPRAERSGWPVVATATGVVWLPGYRPGIAAVAGPGSRRALCIIALPPERVAAIFPAGSAADRRDGASLSRS